MITGILLAAGTSSRMGENKLLLPFKNKTVIETTLDVLVMSNIDNILIVTGHEENRIQKQLKDYNLDFVHNPNYKSGLSSSVKAGLKSINKETQGILFVQADQPMITSKAINEIIDSLNSTNTIIVPRNKERKGSPVAFHKTWFEELKNVSGDKGGRFIIKKYPDQVTCINIKDPLFFVDVDTKEKYEMLKKHL